MSASLFSSFLVFVLSGIIAALQLTDVLPAVLELVSAAQPTVGIAARNWLNRIDDPMIETFLFLSILLNAVYFYYFAAMCELHEVTAKKLSELPSNWEWVTRIFNQTLFLFIWLMISFSGIIFALYMILMYSTFIFWDFQTRAALRPKAAEGEARPNYGNPLRYDVGGLLASALLLVFVLTLPKDGSPPTPLHVFAIGAACMGYALIAVAAIWNGVERGGFNPLQPRLWRRPLCK